MANHKLRKAFICLLVILTAFIIVITFVNKKKNIMKQTDIPIVEDNSYNEIPFIPFSECAETYYANQEDFEIIKDYINSLDIIKADKKLEIDNSFFIGLNNPEHMKKHCINEQMEQSFSHLRESGIIYINFIYKNSDTTWIMFSFYESPEARCGIMWRNHNNKFARVEDKLADNWYIYTYFMV